MKKYPFTLMLLILFMTTVACSNETVNEDESDQVKEEITEKEDVVEENLTEEETEELILEKSKEVLKLLENRNEEELATYVHDQKGVVFSPHVYIEEDAITFDKDKIKTFSKETKTYTWGHQDGSGEPIELTPSNYYQEYIFDGNYLKADEVNYDPNEPRGNTKRNISELFPNSHTVEYYIKGTEENSNMDWKALNLVFEKNAEGEWKLIAIVHDQWTI